MASRKVITVNRQARHEYNILETFEAGVSLTGSEVKSLRDGRANLKDGFARINKGEIFLFNVHISPYRYDREGSYEPTRNRKLLMHREEIHRLTGRVSEKGLTLIPLRMYFKRGKAKVEIALAKGKKLYDKRETLKRREAEREIRRTVAGR